MNDKKMVQAYLNFDGKCDEALNFYKRALGATVEMLMRFKDSPEPLSQGCGPRDLNKVMHAQFRIGESVIMAADGRGEGNPKFEGVSLTVTLPTPADAARAFDALANGGKVEMPLAKTFFSPSFGIVTDRFGLMWMVLTASEAAGNGRAPGIDTKGQLAEAK